MFAHEEEEAALLDAQLVLRALNHPRARTRHSGAVLTLCPFHGEKTPSFVYRPWSRRWVCYGCHKSGVLSEPAPAEKISPDQLAFDFVR